MRKLTAISVVLFSTVSATAAFAEESTEASTADAPAAADEAAPAADSAASEQAPVTTEAAASESAGGGNYNTAPLTLKEGGIGVHADLVINLSKDLVGKPIEISPNLYYGVSDGLTVGLATNPFADTLPLGGGLCLSGTSSGCPKAFNNLSLDALYEVAPLMAVHGGLDIDMFSPELFLSARAGMKMKFGGGPIGVLLDPALSIGLTKRDLGNKEELIIPVRVGYQATEQVNVGAVTGILGPLDHFGDFYMIPLGFNGIYALNETMDLGAQLTFPNLIGKGGTADYRSLALFINFRN